jgi:hypothetical protein
MEMHRNKTIGCVSALAVAVLWLASPAHADTILWIDDTSGNIGQVDLTTNTVVAGSVHPTGQILTDIGFGTNGTLYGTTFANLFSINTSTGAATGIGGNNGIGGMNALVGSGTAGVLLGAANNTTEVYSISQTTGAVTNFKGVPLTSAGDLAFAGSTLYESSVNTNGNDALVNATTGAVIGDFNQGATRFSGVFGLADDGTTMYAVAGTEVYSVNLANAALIPLFDYSGHGLGVANGTAFVNEGSTTPVPEPGTFGLLGAGLLGLSFLARRKHR